MFEDVFVAKFVNFTSFHYLGFLEMEILFNIYYLSIVDMYCSLVPRKVCTIPSE